jgi:hypothetical protein
MQRILSNKVKDIDLSELASRAVADIQDAKSMKWDVEFYYITSARFTPTELSKLENLEGYGEDFFFLDITRIAERLDSKQQELPDKVKDKWFDLRLSSREILKFADKTAVIAVSLAVMHDFVEKGGNELFASNVRQYLRSSRINSGIRETIQKSPEKFWLYNNGITVVCDDFKEDGFNIQVQTPQIVNGCQTAKSIHAIMSKKRDEVRRSMQGHVLVRLIKGANGEERENITRFTNLQNAVRGKDFFSLEDFHKKLQRQIKNLGYYYEIQRGAFTSLKPSDKSKYTGKTELAYLVGNRFKYVVPALESIQAFASGFKNLPGVAMSRPNELTPPGPYYEKVLPVELHPEPKKFLYPFLVREWARENGYSRGAQGGWRAYAAWLFIHGYFVLILRLLKEIGRIDQLENSPEGVDESIWDKIFLSPSLNQSLLQMTDDLLERFFEDSKVHDAVGQDVRKFLRSQDVLDKHELIMQHYADNLVVSPRNRQIVELFHNVISS